MQDYNNIMKGQLMRQAQTPKTQERNQRIMKLINEEKYEIQGNLKKEFQNFMNRCKNQNIQVEKHQMSSQRVEQYNECLRNYIKACSNLLSVYFPILSDNDLISLQRENQILGRVYQLKSSISRSFKSLCSKLIIEQGEKSIQRRKQSEKKLKKGSNSKTPFQYSVILTEWLLKNFNNPYPTNEEKERLAKQSGLSVPQVNNWFINSRERVIKKYLKKQSKQINKQKKNIQKQSDESK